MAFSHRLEAKWAQTLMEDFSYKNKSDRIYIIAGVVFTTVIFTAIIVSSYFWERQPHAPLSCLAVQSSINNLIEKERKFNSDGTTEREHEKLWQNLKVTLEANRKLKCGFNEERILKNF